MTLPVVSYALMGVCVAVYVLMCASGVALMTPSIPDLVKWGADYGPFTTNGQWWRLVSSMFVHIGFLHILLNMYVLSSVGPMAERMFGRRDFTVLYFLSGIAGSIASVCWEPRTVCAGASGAIFGTIGGLLGYLLRRKNDYEPAEYRARLQSILMCIALNVGFGLSVGGVSNSAHLGGLGVGLVAGLILAMRSSQLPKVLGIAVLTIAMVGGAVLASKIVDSTTDAAMRAAESSKASQPVDVGSHQILIRNGATREDAAKLARKLEEIDYFSEKSARGVLLDKKHGEYELSFIVADGAWRDPLEVKSLTSKGRMLSDSVFGGELAKIHLCDKDLTVQRSVSLDDE
jgi:membrane associated rhomboid family serine protease